MKHQIYLVITLLLVIVVGCEPPKKSTEEAIAETNEVVKEKEVEVEKEDAPKISLTKSKIKKSTGGCGESDPCAEVSVTYPKYEGKNDNFINKQIRKKVSELLADFVPNKSASAKSPEQIVDLILADYEEVTGSYDDNYVERWNISIDVEISHIMNDILTVVITSETYQGGAYGSYAKAYYNYNWNTKAELKVGDLVSDLGRLTALAEKQFRKDRGFSATENLADQGFYFDNGFELNDNIGLTPEGLNIYFSDQEIAPHALGPSSIIIPYAQIKDMLKI